MLYFAGFAASFAAFLAHEERALHERKEMQKRASSMRLGTRRFWPCIRRVWRPFFLPTFVFNAEVAAAIAVPRRGIVLPQLLFHVPKNEKTLIRQWFWTDEMEQRLLFRSINFCSIVIMKDSKTK